MQRMTDADLSEVLKHTHTHTYTDFHCQWLCRGIGCVAALDQSDWFRLAAGPGFSHLSLVLFWMNAVLEQTSPCAAFFLKKNPPSLFSICLLLLLFIVCYNKPCRCHRFSFALVFYCFSHRSLLYSFHFRPSIFTFIVPFRDSWGYGFLEVILYFTRKSLPTSLSLFTYFFLSLFLSRWPYIWPYICLYGWQWLPVGESLHRFGSDCNISSSIGWFTMKLCCAIHDPQRINPTDFDDPLTSPLAPPWGWHLWF